MYRNENCLYNLLRMYHSTRYAVHYFMWLFRLLPEKESQSIRGFPLSVKVYEFRFFDFDFLLNLYEKNLRTKDVGNRKPGTLLPCISPALPRIPAPALQQGEIILAMSLASQHHAKQTIEFNPVVTLMYSEPTYFIWAKINWLFKFNWNEIPTFRLNFGWNIVKKISFHLGNWRVWRLCFLLFHFFYLPLCYRCRRERWNKLGNKAIYLTQIFFLTLHIPYISTWVP